MEEIDLVAFSPSPPAVETSASAAPEAESASSPSTSGGSLFRALFRSGEALERRLGDNSPTKCGALFRPLLLLRLSSFLSLSIVPESCSSVACLTKDRSAASLSFAKLRPSWSKFRLMLLVLVFLLPSKALAAAHSGVVLSSDFMQTENNVRIL